MATDLSFVCIAVHDLQEASDRFCNLFGLEVMQMPNDNTQLGYRSTYLGNGSKALIELIEPLGEGSAVGKFLETRGEGVYLITFEVDDIRDSVRNVRSHGGRVTGIPDDEDPGPNADYLWVHPKGTHGVFVEILQKGFGPLPGSS